MPHINITFSSLKIFCSGSSGLDGWIRAQHSSVQLQFPTGIEIGNKKQPTKNRNSPNLKMVKLEKSYQQGVGRVGSGQEKMSTV